MAKPISRRSALLVSAAAARVAAGQEQPPGDPVEAQRKRRADTARALRAFKLDPAVEPAVIFRA